MVENDGYQPLSHSWPLTPCVMSTKSNVQEYGCLCNSFNRKQLKCNLLVHFNHMNQNQLRLTWLFPIEHDLRLQIIYCSSFLFMTLWYVTLQCSYHSGYLLIQTLFDDIPRPLQLHGRLVQNVELHLWVHWCTVYWDSVQYKMKARLIVVQYLFDWTFFVLFYCA